MDGIGSSTKLYLSGRSDRIEQLSHVSLSDGKNNSSVGLGAGTSVKNGANNIFLGAYAGSNAISSGSVFLGAFAGQFSALTKNSCFIGYRAGQHANRVESSVVIGPEAGRKMTRANCNTILGYQAGAELTSGSRNTILGTFAAYSQYNGTDNVCIGHQSGYKNKVGSNNCYIGTNSGFSSSNGVENVCLGVSSGENLNAGTKNVLCGYLAGANITNASNCIAIGTRAMEYFFDGDTNTCLGTETAQYFSGYNNTILGGYSTANASGSYNTIVGSRSMNRATKERVNLSNCVIIGENIQFDIPIRNVTANVASFDLVPDAQILDDDTKLTLTETGDELNARGYLEMNFVPVGDPVLIRQRYVSVGTEDDPVELDTSEPGTYTIQWGSAPSENLTLLDPIPVRLEVVVQEDIQVTLESYGDVIETWTLDPGPIVRLYAAQIFEDPPRIDVKLGSSDTWDIEYTSDAQLPGKRIGIDETPVISGTSVLVYADEEDSEGLVRGMAIQILDSIVPQVNGVWRIRSIGTPTNGKVPIAFTILQAPNLRTTPTLGQNVRLLASRVVTASNVAGELLPGKIRVTLPEFAGMLFDTNILALVEDTVRPVTVVNKYAGTFEFEHTSALVGNISLGSFEPLIVGFDVSASGENKSIDNFSVTYSQRSDKGVQTSQLTGPTAYDGHVHRGAGTQSQLDAAISSNVLTFIDGLSYADYTIGSANSNVSTSVTFEIANDADFGIEWLDGYKLLCSVGSSVTTFATTLSYVTGSRELANISPMVVATSGSLSIQSSEEPTLPIQLSELGNAFTVSLDVSHKIRLQTIDIEITLASVSGKYVTLQLGFQKVPGVSSASASISFFSTKPARAKEIRIESTNYQLYPSFSDCIFLGSNFTVGAQLPLSEKANVFVAAIGNVPLFKGTTEDFIFFSDAVTTNTVHVQGNLTTLGNASVGGDLDVGGSAAVESLTATSNVGIGGYLEVTGDLTAANGTFEDVETSNVAIHGNLSVETHAEVASLDVSDDATFQNPVVMASTLSVSGEVTVGDDLIVSGNTVVQALQTTSATVSEDLEVGGNFSVSGNLASDSVTLISGAGSITLDVNDEYYGNMKITGTATSGWDGLRFPRSQMMLALRSSQAGFYHETDGWRLYMSSDDLYVGGNMVAYHTFSDRRLKANLRPCDSEEILRKLPAYEFDWKSSGKSEIGLIAQDVQKVLPWAVRETEPNQHLVVDYSKLVPLLVDSMSKLQGQVETLTKRVDELEKMTLKEICRCRVPERFPCST